MKYDYKKSCNYRGYAIEVDIDKDPRSGCTRVKASAPKLNVEMINLVSNNRFTVIVVSNCEQCIRDQVDKKIDESYITDPQVIEDRQDVNRVLIDHGFLIKKQ